MYVLMNMAYFMSKHTVASVQTNVKTILGFEEQIGTVQHLTHFQSPRGTRSVHNGLRSEAGVGNGVRPSSCVGHLSSIPGLLPQCAWQSAEGVWRRYVTNLN